jgi:endonuclease/exonuclease/phosphatase family metal-dependent hydrolase
VPGVNLFQLTKINKFLNQIPGQSILIGDFNLPANLPAKLPAKLGGLSSLVTQNTYPSWKPATQFDYILSKGSLTSEHLPTVATGVSDHLPLSVEIS